MKLKIWCKDNVTREVNATKAFNLYGLKFYVHREWQFRRSIMVTELTTGLSVVDKYIFNRAEAIKYARKKLISKGRDVVLDVVSKRMKIKK
jgi:hypothetical protein